MKSKPTILSCNVISFNIIFEVDNPQVVVDISQSDTSQDEIGL